MAKKSYKVLRSHMGDRAYLRGDTRVAEERVVAALVRRGILADMTGKKKRVRTKPEPITETKPATVNQTPSPPVTEVKPVEPGENKAQG